MEMFFLLIFKNFLSNSTENFWRFWSDQVSFQGLLSFRLFCFIYMLQKIIDYKISGEND